MLHTPRQSFRRIFVLQKGYSLVNILGLAIGISICLMLFRVVEFNSGFDDFHPNAGRIYRFVTKSVNGDNTHLTPALPFPFPTAFRNDFPGLTAMAPLFSLERAEIQPLTAGTAGGTAAKGNPRIFSEKLGVFFTDTSFFHIFYTGWLAGDRSMLAQPNMVVLDRTHAARYFDRWENATGSYLKLDNDIILKVAGVIEDYPANSDLPLKMLVSYATLRLYPQYAGSGLGNWGGRTTDHQAFVALPPNVTAAGVNEQLKPFAAKYFNSNSPAKWSVWLQPLPEMHFDGRFSIFSEHTADRGALWTLSAIAVFILLMAMINFVNLATAQAVGRSREIGVRKVLGCNRGRLIGQMLAETGLIVACALLLAVGIGALVFPWLKQMLDVPEGAPLYTGNSLFFLAACEISVTLLSGLYPAIVLSGFNPLPALRNKITTSTIGGISVRWGLVIVQFASLQVLLIGTIVVLRQMNYVRRADMGFNKDAILQIRLPNKSNDSNWNAELYALKTRLAALPGIRSTTFCSAAPASNGGRQSGFFFDNATEYADFNVFYKSADPDYFSTFQLPFVAGRGYEDGNADRGIVINETMRRKLQLPDAQSAIGRTLKMGMLGGEDAPRIPIVGVVRDFKDHSLHDSIDPMAIFHASGFYQELDAKLATTDLSNTVPAIQRLWRTIFPAHVFTWSFLDEDIARFYEQETRLGSLYKLFTGIAIILACLGLFALVSYMAIRRIREMSIRKILGASVGNVVYLFSREFTILILVAFAIAAPCAWLFMQHWLRNFVYRIPLDGGVFLLAITGSLLIAWITIGYHAVKVALVNPAVSLKAE
jgi:ABC-type antimicrobial peptide transport system permease subunit